MTKSFQVSWVAQSAGRTPSSSLNGDRICLDTPQPANLWVMVSGMWLESLCAFQGCRREKERKCNKQHTYLIPSCIHKNICVAVWIRTRVQNITTVLLRKGDSGNPEVPRGHLTCFETTKGRVVHVYVCNVLQGKKVLAGSPAILWLQLLV